jgi:hypothetical protein
MDVRTGSKLIFKGRCPANGDWTKGKEYEVILVDYVGDLGKDFQSFEGDYCLVKDDNDKSILFFVPILSRYFDLLVNTNQ